MKQPKNDKPMAEWTRDEWDAYFAWSEANYARTHKKPENEPSAGSPRIETAVYEDAVSAALTASNTATSGISMMIYTGII